MKHFLILFCYFCSLTAFAQETISLGSRTSPEASINEVEWIQGHWRGSAFGGLIEEIWSPQLGGSMMGSFKMVINDEVSFYELMHVRELEGTLLLQIRHFNQDFTGWETQNESENFPLVRIEKNHVFFDGLTFEKVSEDELHIHVLLSEKDKEPEEITFRYKRYK